MLKSYQPSVNNTKPVMAKVTIASCTNIPSQSSLMLRPPLGGKPPRAGAIQFMPEVESCPEADLDSDRQLVELGVRKHIIFSLR
jgi:hypothetical protein